MADIVRTRSVLGEKTLSYEFFPPRATADADAQLWEAFTSLVNAGVDFVSVTYGAGGSNREKSFSVLETMSKRVLTVGHLTAVGSSAVEANAILERFREAGVSSVLALRGDNPKDDPDALAKGEIKRAIELVDLARAAGLEVGVAAFPEGHPEAPNLDHDARVLSLKQQSGATFALTQLFFGVEHYLRLVEDSQKVGVSIPIIPGVMPIANAKQVLRMAEMSGAKIPSLLVERLVSATEADARKIGMEYTVQTSSELLNSGAPGLHIYTLNQSGAALEIASSVGLLA